MRVLMALVLGAAVLAAVWFLPQRGFDLLILAVTALGLAEFARLFSRAGWWRVIVWIGGMLVAALMLFGPIGKNALPLLLIGILFAVTMIVMARAPELSGSAERIALAMLGVLYLGLTLPCWAWLRALEWGRALVLLALVPACLSDTAAYLVGKSCGRRKFAPRVSPNKTVEGFFGALAGSLIGALAVWWLLVPALPLRFVIALAGIVWIVAPLGDLIESLFKRSCGVKDSGSVIPGHGGILDRLDALIFTGPAAYAFFALVVGMGRTV